MLLIAVNISTINTFKIQDCLSSDRYLRYVQGACFLVLHDPGHHGSAAPFKLWELNSSSAEGGPSSSPEAELDLHNSTSLDSESRKSLHQLGSDFLGWTFALTHPEQTRVRPHQPGSS